ncbi:hypothetical protein [Okeania sp. KiyG1]|uniref:hypothetical protein n=1 Tax=Okeania sp. KiyG1 TaxID=2720165 RepID=UPI00192245DF|nr:hypothetical protein [Okeania sp. KiyG1]
MSWLYHVRLNTYNIYGPKAEGSYAEGRRERVRLEGRRFFISDYPDMILYQFDKFLLQIARTGITHQAPYQVGANGICAPQSSELRPLQITLGHRLMMNLISCPVEQ